LPTSLHPPKPTAPALGPRSRGRPPTTQLDTQLIIELRRLTDCGARSIGWALSRVKRKGALAFLQEPTETSLKRAFCAGDLNKRTRPEPSLKELPGWCAVHIVPVLVNENHPWDMALLWEPFSHAVFGDIRPTFDDADDRFAEFVSKSLSKLPRPLVDKISTIRLTTPRANAGFDHWYASATRRLPSKSTDASAGLGVVAPGKRRIPIENDPETDMWGFVDLRRHLQGGGGYHARRELILALDAHNLIKRPEKSCRNQPPWVQTAWRDKGGPTFDPEVSQKRAHNLPPQERLTRSLRQYETVGLKAWSGSGDIALKLSYRASDPSARRHFPATPWVGRWRRTLV
jgi:hypothetical protein